MRYFVRILIAGFLVAGAVGCGQQPEPSTDLFSRAGKDFPKSPHEDRTPGELCKRGDETRYPERIQYCRRDVESDRKRGIFRDYDRAYGYHMQSMNRMEFKIDHLIPLCMGGSNNDSNLWPQHKEIYELTDPIEPLLCDLMAAGSIKQLRAVQEIMDAKRDPESTPSRVRKLSGLYRQGR
jgi:hypothetical protein